MNGDKVTLVERVLSKICIYKKVPGKEKYVYHSNVDTYKFTGNHVLVTTTNYGNIQIIEFLSLMIEPTIDNLDPQ